MCTPLCAGGVGGDSADTPHTRHTPDRTRTAAATQTALADQSVQVKSGAKSHAILWYNTYIQVE
jgi:hypothetical protein